MPPYHTAAGGEPDVLASSPLTCQGARLGPQPGKPLRVWWHEQRGHTVQHLPQHVSSTRPMGCRAHWMPAQRSPFPGGKTG